MEAAQSKSQRCCFSILIRTRVCVRACVCEHEHVFNCTMRTNGRAIATIFGWWCGATSKQQFQYTNNHCVFTSRINSIHSIAIKYQYARPLIASCSHNWKQNAFSMWFASPSTFICVHTWCKHPFRGNRDILLLLISIIMVALSMLLSFVDSHPIYYKYMKILKLC